MQITKADLIAGLSSALAIEDFEPRPTVSQLERIAANILEHIQAARNTEERARVTGRE